MSAEFYCVELSSLSGDGVSGAIIRTLELWLEERTATHNDNHDVKNNNLKRKEITVTSINHNCSERND